MKCKFCQAELEEGVTLCSVCGQDNAQEEEIPAEVDNTAQETVDSEETNEEAVFEEEVSEDVMNNADEEPAEEAPAKKKMTSGKLAVIYICVIAVLAVLVALVLFGLKDGSANGTGSSVSSTEGTVPADGNKDDVTCQGSYTVSDKKAKSKADKVVAAMEGAELTNGELQTFYWLQVYNFMSNYGSSASAYGVDFSLPLDQQVCTLSEDGWTWQQYFLNIALQDWQMYNAFCREAEAKGFEGTTDVAAYIENIQTSLEESAASQGYESVEEMVKADMGPGASMEGYLSYVELTETGYDYYAHLYETLVPSDDQIRAFYEENLTTFEENGITDDGSLFVDVRHILLQPAETDDEGEYTEDAWADCEKEAQALLDQWLAGDKTEDSFAALANEHSVDPGSNTAGGLYQYVQAGEMVTEFNDWCFDESRQPGDYGLVKTVHGYHIMYFVRSQPVWYVYAQDGAKGQLLSDTIDALMEKYPAEVDYSKIVLGFVDQTT